MENVKVLIISILVFSSSIIYAKDNFLQKDVDRFKKEGNCPKCDLSSANLNDIDHSNIDITGATLSNAKASFINLSSSNLFRS